MSQGSFDFNTWAQENSLHEECIAKLKEDRMDTLENLLDITEEDLQDMGLKRGDKKSLTRAIAQLRSSHGQTTKQESREIAGELLVARQQGPSTSSVGATAELDVGVRPGKVVASRTCVEPPAKTDSGEQDEDPAFTQLAKALGSDALEKAKQASQGNLEKLAEYADAVMKSKLTQPIRLAVTGQSGSGKSTFINTNRGLEAGDPGAAAVGIEETTMKIAEYKHPLHPNLVMCDLPGAGTQNFPLEGYFDMMKLDTYDVVIIVSCGRFTEGDAKLAKTLLEKKKPVILVRSKFDQDVVDYRKPRAQRKATVEDVKNVLLPKIQTDLGKIHPRLTKISIFFINCDKIMDFDFPKLQEHLYVSVPEYKRVALLNTMTTHSAKLLEEKRLQLKAGVFSAAIKAAAGGFVPILNLILDSEIIESNVKKYIVQFGLDMDSMEKISEKYDIPMVELSEITDKYMKNMMNPSTDDIIAFFTTLMEVLGSVILGTLSSIPLLGALVAVPLAYKRVSSALNEAIQRFYNCAVEVNQYISLVSR